MKKTKIPKNIKPFVDQYNYFKKQMRDKFNVLKEMNKIPDTFDIRELTTFKERMTQIENGQFTCSLNIKPYLKI